MPREYVREEMDWFSYRRDNVYQEMELGGGTCVKYTEQICRHGVRCLH